MRIGFDARYLSHGLLGGVHTYVMQLLPALLEAGRHHEFVVFIDDKAPFELEGRCGDAAVHRLRWRSKLSTVRNDWMLPKAIARHALDVMHYPANYGAAPAGTATVMTVHDAMNLVPLRFVLANRHSRTTLRRSVLSFYLSRWTRWSVEHADLIATISESSRDAIVARMPSAAGRIEVVYPGEPSDWSRVEDPATLDDVAARFGLPSRYVLADALKNPEAVVRAWRALPEGVRLGARVVFFARTGDLLPIVGDAVRAGDAQLLIRPSRADLAALFTRASAFLFPSWLEGFGLPLLEAMTCGTPIVASTRGSIPEVTGPAALLAAPDDVPLLARHLEAVLTDEAVSAGLVAAGYRQLQRFTWSRCAAQFLDVYAAAAARRKRRA